MKKRLFLAFFVLCILALVISAFHENLILNPGFEVAGSGGPDVFADWTESTAGSSTVNDETTEVHSGSHACRFDVDASDSSIAIFSSTFALIPGARYKLFIWYKNSVVGKTSQLFVVNSTNNIGLKSDGTWGEYPSGMIISNSTVWTEYTIEFNAHVDYTVYKIILKRYSAASSSIYYDDLSLRQIPSEEGIVKPIVLPIVKRIVKN